MARKIKKWGRDYEDKYINPKKEEDNNNKSKVHFLYRVQAYFMHGHGGWTGFIVSIGTFMMVLYSFGYANFHFFREWFANPVIYLMIAFPAYFILATSIGYWSYYKGAFAERVTVEWNQNPVFVKMRDDIDSLKKEISEIKDMLVSLQKANSE